ncbi:MAG: glycosyltransferase [Elusimicrobiaceae bacterium]|nr:glycosyltransferase [Elusimicrobiaceae bacterium]
MILKKPIRILQITCQLHSRDGVAVVLKNWHNNIDTSQIQFDYLIWWRRADNDHMIEELSQKGANIFILPDPQQYFFQFLKESYCFFKTHHYCTIHSHITHLNFFFYPLAKWFGTKNIIQHAHSARWSEKKLSRFRNYLMLHAVWPLITHKMACSHAAGKAYYGKDFMVVNNGINIEKFTYNPVIRKSKRRELGLENDFIIGHVGRFSAPKNHPFLLNVFEQVLQMKPNAKLLLVGSGPLRQQTEELVRAKNLQKHVVFLGGRTDVEQLYQAFDCFVFPSLHEGLGIVAIEAQAAGLPCILADTLPQEAFICNYKKMALGYAKEWAQAIVTCTEDFKRTDTSAQIKAAGFSAQAIAKQMQDFYLELKH